MQSKYKRALLRLNDESLAGGKEHGIDSDTALKICALIRACVDLGVQVGIVVGNGNFWRGHSSRRMDRTRADHMGMLVTVINTLGVVDALKQLGVSVRVQTAITMQQVAKPYIYNRVVRHLERGHVVVFGYGTSNSFLFTDTATSLHATEIDADTTMKAALVNGAYGSDPKLNETAVKLNFPPFMDVLNKNLHVIDSTTTILCKDNDIPILVFSIADPENILRAVCGELIGTLVRQLISQKQK